MNKYILTLMLAVVTILSASCTTTPKPKPIVADITHARISDAVDDLFVLHGRVALSYIKKNNLSADELEITLAYIGSSDRMCGESTPAVCTFYNMLAPYKLGRLTDMGLKVRLYAVLMGPPKIHDSRCLLKLKRIPHSHL